VQPAFSHHVAIKSCPQVPTGLQAAVSHIILRTTIYLLPSSYHLFILIASQLKLADNIKYCSIFYEGQHDDARTNLAIALTAAERGAAIANYCSVIELQKGADGKKVTGAIVRDEITGEKFAIRAKAVALCGGPFTDELRKMEEPNSSPAVRGATGL